MYKSLVIILSFYFSLLQLPMFGQESKGGMEFFHGSFSEALEKANAEGKIIFMDAFTTWCGPCRRMASSTFPDSEVGGFYNANFINLKVDMEKGEGPDLSIRYSVNSYPTLLYIDGTGKVVHKGVGMRGPEQFIELGREALKKNDRSGEFAKKYEAGDRDPKTVLEYIKSLNMVGKSSLKITNEYLATQKNLKSKENLEIILEGTTEADSRIFDLLIQNKDEIIKLKKKEVFEAKVYQACFKTYSKALEFRNEALLKEAQSKIKFNPNKAQDFVFQTNMEYYGKTGDAKQYLISAKSYVKKVVKNDAVKLTATAQNSINYFRTDKNVVDFAEGLAKKAMENGGLSNQYFLYGSILKMQGKHQEAIKVLRKGLELAKERMEAPFQFEQMLRELESK